MKSIKSSKKNIQHSPSVSQTTSAENKIQQVIFTIPIICLIGIVPLLAHYYPQQLGDSIIKFYGKASILDVYTHIKAIAIIVAGISMIGILFFTFQKNDVSKLKERPLFFIALAVFVVMTLCSGAFSQYKELSLWGAPYRYEGLVVQLIYALAVVYIYLRIESQSQLKYVEVAIVVLSVGMLVLGLGYLMLKTDLLMVKPLSCLVALGTGIEAGSIGRIGAVTEQLVLTFGNSNYVGSFYALLLPMLAGLCIQHKQDTKKWGLLLLLTIGNAMVLMVSASRAGQIGLLFGLPLFLFYTQKFSLKKIGIVTLTLMILFVAADQIRGGIVLYKSELLLKEVKLLFSQTFLEFDETYGLPVYDIQLKHRSAVIYTTDGVVKLKSNGVDSYSVTNESGENVLKEISQVEGKRQLNMVLMPPFEKLSIRYTQFDGEKQGVLLYYDEKLTFLLEDNFKDGFFFVDPNFIRWDFIKAPSWGFKGLERIGSGRGYIWSRTIPLLKNNLLIGSGPDTFVTQFPRGDYLAEMYVNGGTSTFAITDKPHNMYLQWGIQNGVISLLSIITLVIVTMKSLWENRKSQHVFLGLLPAIVAYSITGLFNDSYAGIAQIFWVFLGLAIAVTRKDWNNN